MALTALVNAPRRVATSYVVADALTPADNTFIGPYEALWVGVAGDITLVPANSTTPTLFKGVPAGLLPVRCQSVNATGTTATNLVGLG